MPIPKKLSVKFYRTDTGTEPVREWLKSLPALDRKAIGTDIKTVQFGWPVGMPIVKSVSGYPGMWEVRTKLTNGIARVFFTITGDAMVLLHGIIKKSQKTPKTALNIAKKRMSG